ncbi:unnamed protein product [Adineta steineri]|uniref:Glutathione reductase n=2 Tax=Adineta steineri TaxID=433720 RepID=A0A814PLH8_9BILA|nr:unnamed protein product [Adineta steineri]
MLLHRYCVFSWQNQQIATAYKFSRIVSSCLQIQFQTRRTMSSGNEKFDYDYFVIGGGSGGVRSSRIAGKLGARVALAEEKKLGGTCVNVGCVPKKLFCYASHFRELFHDAHSYGWPKLDMKLEDHNWKKFIESKNAEIQRLNDAYEKTEKDANVKVLKGHATLKDKHTVIVDGKEYTSKYILLAVGGHPVIPKIEGHEHIITSDDAFFLENLPKKVTIVGGGYIALEFACIFHGFGCEVSLILRGKTILRSFDEDVRSKLTDELKKNGINFRFETEIESVEKLSDESFRVKFKNDKTTVDTNLVMFAIGRKPQIENLGLDIVGVKTDDKGVIQVDDYSQTNIPNIYAVGDCTDRTALTPVAIQEGHYLANMLFKNEQPRKVDYATVGTTVFSEPAIGTCGVTEQQAIEKYGPDGYDVYESTFKPMFVQLPKRDRKSYVKLIVEKDSQRVVGIHIMDHAAPEIIQMCSVAIRAGATKELFDHSIDVRSKLTDELKKNGINFRFETEIESVEKLSDESFRVKFKNDKTTVDTNLVMFAIGRKPQIENLGLDIVGVKTDDKGVIQVDDYSQTNIPNIYAVGDCTDRTALTPVAIQEGHYLANMLFKNDQPRKVDYATVGTTVFSEPAIGTCGVTEQQAIEKYGPDGYDVYESTFKPMFVQLPKRDRKSYVKLIVEKDSQRVVGIHIMDHAAPEIIQMCSVAIRAGATKELFDHSIGIHPTSAEEIVQIREKREKKKE